MNQLSAVVKYDYVGAAHDEISLSSGEQVVVIEIYDDGWWLVCKDDGTEGLAPSNYLEAASQKTDDSSLSHSIQKGFTSSETESSIPVEVENSLAPSEEYDSSSHTHLINAGAEELSSAIMAKINAELSIRDSKIIEEVRRMIGQSTAPLLDLESKLAAAEMAQNHFKSQTHGLPAHRDSSSSISAASSKSKIPARVSLPKISNASTEKEPTKQIQRDSKDAYKKRRASLIDSKLPVLVNKNRNSKDILLNEDSTEGIESATIRIESSDGIKYPQCRSKVYAPSHRKRNPDPRPAAELRLEHVYGYDGDFNRRGSAIRGKNIFWLDKSRILYPAAALVVIQDIVDRRQSFFSGHTDDVTCIAVHRMGDHAIVASAQLGKECDILLWDASQIETGCAANKCSGRLAALPGVRGVSGIDFSGDGRFLLAVGIDESHSMMIFDWKEGTMVAHAKVGHVDVSEVVFNPFLFTALPACEVPALLATPIKSPAKAVKESSALAHCGAGCYTIVSYGKKNVKFWTLKEFYAEDPNALEDISSFRGRRLSVRKDVKDFTLKYALEGTLAGSFTHGPALPPLTSYFITNEASHEAGGPKSRVFMGTGEGSIYVWHHVEDPAHKSDAAQKSHRTAWLPRGKLSSVITELHDAAIVSMDYLHGFEKVMSCSADGVINVWNFCSNSVDVPIPLEHIGSFELDNEFARSVSWNQHGSYAVLGTACNSVLLVMCGDNVASIDSGGNSEPNDCFSIEVLTQSHDGKVHKIAVNPKLQSLYASISSDKSVRLWDSSRHTQLCYFQLSDPATAVAFSNEGKFLATGDEHGELSVFVSEELNAVLGSKLVSSDDIDLEPLLVASWKQIVRKNICVKTDQSGGNAKRKSIRKYEITEIKYSPSGEQVAIGSRDKLIHVLSTVGYKHIAVCRGHSSYIRNIDYSESGSFIQSTDANRELLHWDAQTGQRVTRASIFRDLRWNTISCVYGWGVMGVFNGGDEISPVEGEINCVSGSPDGKWLVAGGSHTVHHAVKIFNYPCLSDAIPSFHGGHTSPVLDVAFTVGLTGSLAVITAGGNDSCIFQWRLIGTSG